MAESNNSARSAYLDWLKGEVERWCNKDGFFEAEWDYDDSITPDQILDAYQSYEEQGYASPLACLESKLFEDTYIETDFYENYLMNDLASAGEEVNDGWDSAQSVWEDLESVGYKGIDLNLDQLLGQSELRVNVFFATETEQNFDMGSIVNAFGNDYRSPDLDRIDGEDLDNALSYLVNQQGHSVAEVYDARVGCDPAEQPFIYSVREEITENSSEAMSELAALIRMDGNQMLDFLDAIEKGTDSLVLPKDYATIGIFNQWSGCGGTLDIHLEKDAVLPLSMVREFNIEGQTETSGSYTVDSVYGLVSSMWCPNFSYREGVESGVKEDYDVALEQARESRDAAEQLYGEPNLNDLIPDDLELLRVGMGADALSVGCYTLSGREGHFYSLVEGPAAEGLSTSDIENTLILLLDHCDDPSTYAYVVLEDMMGVVWTNGLEENDPATFAQHEFNPLDGDYSLDGEFTDLEIFPAETLNAASRLSERQRDNIEMAYARLNPGGFMPAAQLLARYDLERWHAFEVCEAVSASIPMGLVADIANPELTFKQARGLRYLAQTIYDSHMHSDVRVLGLFHQVAAHTDFSEDKIHAIGTVLKATPRFEFEDCWLGLSTDQLRSVKLALDENVPPSFLHRYSHGEYPAENMDILTLAARDGEAKEPQLMRLLHPDLSLGQLVESWSAAVDCGKGKLSATAFDLICNPQLPQPVMNALRLGLTYYDLPLDAARTVTAQTKPEEVWDLVGQERDEAITPSEGRESDSSAPKMSDSGSLRDEATMSREASGRLSQEHGAEQVPQREEIE